VKWIIKASEETYLGDSKVEKDERNADQIHSLKNARLADDAMAFDGRNIIYLRFFLPIHSSTRILLPLLFPRSPLISILTLDLDPQ
jgi:hypothetical protein